MVRQCVDVCIFVLETLCKKSLSLFFVSRVIYINFMGLYIMVEMQTTTSLFLL